ncbi:hypothetical protein PhCBS80983_g05784 [Powellomyces hirtus]|uniref:TOG domain-containing protein n=1 Tax=Powellomyces hirtus TaxID=109895 RepID=A0A507DUW7_9FUNG|nr:hypothetical protein PhCBS80983_g05784 [Powellomyces hirtus]
MDNNELGVSLGSENTISRLSALESLRAELKTSGVSRWQDHTVAGDLLSGVAWTLCDRDQKVAFESFQFLLEFLPICLGSCEDVVEVAIIPVVIANLGDTKLQIRRQALRVLDVYLQHASGVDSFLESLVHYGLESEDWRARKESAAAIPTLLTKNMLGVKWLPLVSALILRLQDISDVVIKASLAALRHICASHGEDSLAKIVNMLPGLSRQIFKKFETRILNGKTLDQLTSGNIANLGMHAQRQRYIVAETKPDETPTPSQPTVLPSPPCSAKTTMNITSSQEVNKEAAATDVTFGVIPTILVNELRIKTDWRRRSMAADSLLRYITSMEKTEPLIPHLKDLIEFMRTLLEDVHFRIAMTALQAFGELVSKLGPHMQPVLVLTTSCLVEKLGDNKLALRQAVAKVLLRLMGAVNPESVLLLCLEHVGTENPKIREEVVNLVANAILVFPDAGWNYLVLVTNLIDRLDDNKPRVKCVTIEVFAVMAAMIEPTPILNFVRDLGVNEETIQLLEFRFMDPSLPQLNSDQLIEHIVSRSNMTTPLPLSATPTRERAASALGRTNSRVVSRSAPVLPQPFLAQPDPGSSETVLRTNVRALDRALSASSQSELIDDGAGPRGATAKGPQMPWERPRSNAANRFSYHGDMQRAIDESMSTVRRVRSFSDSQEPSNADTGVGNTRGFGTLGLHLTTEPHLDARDPILTNPHMIVEGHSSANGHHPSQWEHGRDVNSNADRYPASSKPNIGRPELASSSRYSLEEIPADVVSKDQFPARRTRFRGSMVPGPTAMDGEEPVIRRSRDADKRRTSTNGIPPAAELPLHDSGIAVDNGLTARRADLFSGRPAVSSFDTVDRPSLHRATTSPRKKLSAPQKGESPASAPPGTVTKRGLASLEATYNLALQQLRGNPDWNVKVEALETVKTVLDECPTIVTADLHDLILAVVATVHNLRSSVSKHAITILHTMYSKLGKTMEADLDLTVGSLMKKVGEGTGFILEEVDKALLAMTNAVSPTRGVAALLLSAEHKNPVVRMRVACLCCKVVTDMSQSQAARYVHSYGDAGKLFTALVQFLREGMAETRNAAKRIIIYLSEMPDFNRALEKVLAMKQANEIREALKSSSRSPSVPSVPVRSPSKRTIIKPRDVREAPKYV